MQPGSTCLTLQALASLKIVLNARDHRDGSFAFRVTQTLSHATQKCSKERPCMQTELNLLSFRNFMVALTYRRWTPKYFSTQ